MQPYRTLNDASIIHPELSRGLTRIWYTKPHYIPRFIFGLAVVSPTSLIPEDPKKLGRSHVCLGQIASENLEQIFQMLQGESWSPAGQARELILEKRLQHTSMSVGDCIVLKDTIYMADVFGFVCTKTYLRSTV